VRGIFFSKATALIGPGPPHCWGFLFTLGYTHRTR